MTTCFTHTRVAMGEFLLAIRRVLDIMPTYDNDKSCRTCQTACTS